MEFEIMLGILVIIAIQTMWIAYQIYDIRCIFSDFAENLEDAISIEPKIKLDPEEEVDE